jgi:hypothetical protein
MISLVHIASYFLVRPLLAAAVLLTAAAIVACEYSDAAIANL